MPNSTDPFGLLAGKEGALARAAAGGIAASGPVGWIAAGTIVLSVPLYFGANWLYGPSTINEDARNRDPQWGANPKMSTGKAAPEEWSGEGATTDGGWFGPDGGPDDGPDGGSENSDPPNPAPPGGNLPCNTGNGNPPEPAPKLSTDTGGAMKGGKGGPPLPKPTIRPEKGYMGSKKHGVNWNEGPATARSLNTPQGQWTQADLDFAATLAQHLKPGQGGWFQLPPGSTSKIHMPNGTTVDAQYIWLRNNGSGTFHGYPGIKPPNEPILN